MNKYYKQYPSKTKKGTQAEDKRKLVNVPCPTWGLSGTKRIFSDMTTLDEAK